MRVGFGTRARSAARWFCVAAIGCGVAVAVAPSSAGAAAGWTKLSSSGSNLDQPGLVRTADGKLHIVYHVDAGSTESYVHRTISSQGAVAAGTNVQTGWTFLHQQPVLIRNGTGIRLVFSGLRSTTTGAPYTSGAMYTATSANGSSWALAVGSMSKSTKAYGSYGTGALVYNNKPVSAFAFNEAITYHVGVGAKEPATEGDGTLTQSGCCTYGTTLASDPATGQVYAGWSSLANSTERGLFVQRILPTVGARLRVPNSVNAHNDFLQPLRTVALASRVGGGAYQAYCVGYPTCTGLRLWKVGAAGAITVPGSAGASPNVAIAPAPGGRIWVIWYKGTKVYAVSSNAGATSFGTVRSFAPPAGTGGIYGVQGEASGGALDLVINTGANLWHMHVT